MGNNIDFRLITRNQLDFAFQRYPIITAVTDNTQCGG